jgi:hypothetical protein
MIYCITLIAIVSSSPYLFCYLFIFVFSFSIFHLVLFFFCFSFCFLCLSFFSFFSPFLFSLPFPPFLCLSFFSFLPPFFSISFFLLLFLLFLWHRPNEQTIVVPPEDVHISTPNSGDVVSFSYVSQARRDKPVDPKIFRIRTDVSWEDVVLNYNKERKFLNG